MLKVANKEEAKHLFELTQIAAAPHTKKGVGTKKLLEQYAKIISED